MVRHEWSDPLPLLNSGPFLRKAGWFRTVLPLGCGRCVHLVVVHQGANHDPLALAETGLLFDAVVGELAAVAGCQPRLIVGDFKVAPNLISCLLIGIGMGSGLISKKFGQPLLGGHLG